MFIAILLVSKIPTLALKKISISPKATVFLLLGIGVVFIALLFYTLETFLFWSSLSVINTIKRNNLSQSKQKKLEKISDDNHEDIL